MVVILVFSLVMIQFPSPVFPYRQTPAIVMELFLDVGIVHRWLRRVIGLSVSTTFDENMALLLDREMVGGYLQRILS